MELRSAGGRRRSWRRLSLSRLSTREERLRVFAVEDTSVQLTWRRLGPGEVVVRTAGRETRIETNGGRRRGGRRRAASPITTHELRVTGAGAAGYRRVLRARHAARRPPARSCSGSPRSATSTSARTSFGSSRPCTERPQPDGAAPVRCTRAAIAEAQRVGRASPRREGRRRPTRALRVGVGRLRRAGRRAPVPGRTCSRATTRPAPSGSSTPTTPRSARPQAAATACGSSTCRASAWSWWTAPSPGNHHRRDACGPVADAAVEAVAERPRPAVVAAAPQRPRAGPVPHFWPPGRLRPRGHAVLRAPRRRPTPPPRHLGPHPPPPAHRPRAGRGHRGGLDQGLPRHVGRLRGPRGRHPPGRAPGRAPPTASRWTEYTRWAAVGSGACWSPGRLSDRCFTHPWPSRD